MENATFRNFKYSDNLKYGSYIVRFDEYTLVTNNAENSTFRKDIRFL